MILNVAKLNQELATLRTEKQETAKVIETSTEEKKKLEKQIEELQEEIKRLKGKMEESKKEEAAVVVAVEESVNKKVVQNLAAIGVKEGTVKDEMAPITPTSDDVTEIYKKFESLTGSEKIEYFKKNEKAILKAMKVIHFTNNPLAKVGSNIKF